MLFSLKMSEFISADDVGTMNSGPVNERSRCTAAQYVVQCIAAEFGSGFGLQALPSTPIDSYEQVVGVQDHLLLTFLSPWYVGSCLLGVSYLLRVVALSYLYAVILLTAKFESQSLNKVVSSLWNSEYCGEACIFFYCGMKTWTMISWIHIFQITLWQHNHNLK